MIDPSLLLTIGSTALNVWGQYNQGQQMNDAYKYNAGLADLQGNIANIRGNIAKEQIARQGKRLLSTQNASYAKAGVTMSGSPLEVMLDSAANIEYDKSIADYNSKIEELSYRSRAEMLRYYGKVAKNEAIGNMGKTLLGGAMSLSDYGGGPSRNTGKVKGGGGTSNIVNNDFAMSEFNY